MTAADPLDDRDTVGRSPSEVPGVSPGVRRSPSELMRVDLPDLPSGAVRMSAVEPTAVRWLWPGYVPAGKLTIVDGDPGLGKSTMVLDLAARVSTGDEMPDGSVGVQRRSVILVAGEDGAGDTIRPRLEAHGADVERIIHLQTIPITALQEDGITRVKVGERPPALPTDVSTIRSVARREPVGLIIVDPLSAHLDQNVNLNSDGDVRQALLPLTKLADDLGVAVIVIRHLNKSGGADPLYRGGGSIGIIGAARSAFLVGRDPSDPDLRILASTKLNLARPPQSLRFRLVTSGTTSRTQWEGPTSLTATQLLGDSASPVLDAAGSWLMDALRDGPVPSGQIFDLGHREGFSEISIKRAKRAIGAKSRKGGMTDGWLFYLPSEEDEP